VTRFVNGKRRQNFHIIWRVRAFINTHGHYDLVGFYLHRADEQLLKHANPYRMLFESRGAIRIPPSPTICPGPRQFSRLGRSKYPGYWRPAIPTTACAHCSAIFYSLGTA
jgi:hypothetical protein